MPTESSTISLKRLYFSILKDIADNMTNGDREDFKFWCSGDIPKNVFETDQPFKWFVELQRRGKISPDKLTYIEEFLSSSKLWALREKVRIYYKERRRTMLEKKVEENNDAEDKDQSEKGSRCRQLCYKGKTKGMYRRFLVMERLLARQVLERFTYAESETKGRCSDSQCKSKAEVNTILLSKVESLKSDLAKQSNMLAFFGGVFVGAVLVTIIILKI